jgi:inhibitor of KinA sporulation pathway (predicted exonuclease)
MRHRRVIASAAAFTVVFGLAAVLGLAQDKPGTRREVKSVVRMDADKLEQELDRVLIQLDTLRGLKVRVRGPKDFKLDVDLSGLGGLLHDIERWGEHFDRNEHRRLTNAEKRKLRRALKRLEDLDIDLDFDFDFDIR